MAGQPHGYKYWTDEAKEEYDRTRPRCSNGDGKVVWRLGLCARCFREAIARGR
jgi:ribosomal protein S14